MKNSTTEGLHVTVFGRVQGVGYRFAAYNEASRLGLKGWIRNVSDKCVEAWFEGDEAVVMEMLAWCHTGSPRAEVTSVAHERRAIETPHVNFRIIG